MARPKVEYRVGRMLRDFDAPMYSDYARKTRLFQEKSKKMTDRLPAIDHPDWKLSDGENVPVFYAGFNEPVYMVLNSPLSLFRRLSSRGAGTQDGGQFFYRYGLVPVYFASMNTMSVLKLYQDRAGKVFDPSSRFFGEIRCIELGHKKGDEHPNPVKFSSFNIIEQGAAKERRADEMVSDWFYNRYFTYGFWLQPRKGFVPATHMEFGAKMSAVFKLSKSVYVVDSLGPRREITVAGKEVAVHDAEVRGVIVDTLRFRERFKATIEASILDELTEGNPKKFPLLNGIMMEVRDRDGMKNGVFKKILTVNAGYGSTYSDVIRLAMGMYCYRICRELGTVSRLSDAGMFRSMVRECCNNWMRELSTGGAPESKADDIYDAAMDDMFPMMVADESSVYFTNPIIIGFLKKWDLITGSKAIQRSILLMLLPVLEKIAKLSLEERPRISRDNDYQELAKLVGGDRRFVPSLIKLVNEIRLTNLIRKTYQTGTDEEGRE